MVVHRSRVREKTVKKGTERFFQFDITDAVRPYFRNVPLILLPAPLVPLTRRLVAPRAEDFIQLGRIASLYYPTPLWSTCG